jgi:hypothetical protein
VLQPAFFFFFYYSYVHTRLGSFHSPAPTLQPVFKGPGLNRVLGCSFSHLPYLAEAWLGPILFYFFVVVMVLGFELKACAC